MLRALPNGIGRLVLTLLTPNNDDPFAPSEQAIIDVLNQIIPSNSNALDVFGFETLANMSASPGPLAKTVAWNLETDAPYEFIPGSTATIDGWLVLGQTGGTSGRWLIKSNQISLAPIDGTSDDWPRLASAMVACAYKVEIHLRAGTWQCKTKQVTPNGTTILGESGVTLLVSLTPNPPGGAEDACPFYNDGGPTGINTTLNGAHAAGVQQLTLTSAAAYQIGNRIRLDRGLARASSYQIRFIAGNVVTLDRPLERSYANNDPVTGQATAREIRLIGNGAKVGTLQAPATGDRFDELITGWDNVVSGWEVTSNFTYFVIGFDVAGFHNLAENNWVDCMGFSASAFCAEYNESTTIANNRSFRATGDGTLLTGCDNCHVINDFGAEHAGAGVALTANDPTDTIGCQGCTVSASTYVKNLHGARVDSGSSGNVIDGCAFNYNSGVGLYFTLGTGATATSGNMVVGGSAKGNTTSGCFADDGSITNVVTGWNGVDNVGSHVASVSGSSLLVVGAVITDHGVATPSAGMMLASGAASVLRSQSVKVITTRTGASYAVGWEINGTITTKSYLDGDCVMLAVAGQNSIGCFATQGVYWLRGFQKNLGSDGIFLTGATARAWRLSVDVSGNVTPFTVAGGAQTSVNDVVGTGAAAPIPWDQFKATDNMIATRIANGGAPVGNFIVTPTAGAPTLTTVAGDLSTFRCSAIPA